jgi:anti-sigma regulatory factor (Ser/Thr protein kinase)
VRLRQEFPLDPSAPRRARLLLDGLRAQVGDDVVDAARLVVSELVTNSVRHGGEGGTVVVEIAGDDERVRVEAASPSGQSEPRLVEPGYRGGGGGLGLRLVDSLASRWGVCARGDMTVVWAEIALR